MLSAEMVQRVDVQCGEVTLRLEGANDAVSCDVAHRHGTAAVILQAFRLCLYRFIGLG